MIDRPLPGTRPAKDYILKLRDRLYADGKIIANNGRRKIGVRAVYRELLSEGYTISRSAVQRLLEKNSPKAPEPEPSAEELATLDPKLIPSVAQLIRDNSSTSLALLEDRTRMALNIILARQMAANSLLMLDDMKATAALVDSLTKSAKLSGAHAIDIHIPTREEIRATRSPNGTMKDITPLKTDLARAIDEWQLARPKAEHVKIT